MNNEEIQSLIEQLKAQGLQEDEIMQVFYDTFKEGKMDRKDLEALAEAMGYELTDDFKNEEAPDPIEAGAEGAEGGLTEEKAEDLKEIKPGESEEEFKEKVEEAAPAEEEEKPAEEEKGEEPAAEPEEEKSEDEEWEEAKKLFKL